jgi:hypothetical protein
MSMVLARALVVVLPRHRKFHSTGNKEVFANFNVDMSDVQGSWRFSYNSNRIYLWTCIYLGPTNRRCVLSCSHVFFKPQSLT